MKKRIWAGLLALCLLWAALPAYAAEDTSTEMYTFMYEENPEESAGNSSKTGDNTGDEEENDGKITSSETYTFLNENAFPDDSPDGESETEQEPDLDVKIPISTVRKWLAGGTEYLDKYGVTREKLVAELNAHRNDRYYLGTVCLGGDWQSPRGDTSYNGSAGMNCAGFVAYVLRRCGLNTTAALRDMRKNPAFHTWGTSRTYAGLSAASNYIGLVQYGNLVSYVYDSKNDLLKGGKAEKGDLILRFWTNHFTGNDVDNHLMIFWGDSPGEDKVWESAGGLNRISSMTNSPASAWILIKFAPPEPPAPPPTFAGFTDVREKDWFAPSVQYVKDNGYMQGKTVDTFCPEHTVTRAQAVQVLYNMAGSPPAEDAETPLPFTDMVGHWAEPAVRWAYTTGISSGLEENLFAPDVSITREQMAVLFRRYYDFTHTEEYTPDSRYLNPFTDRALISSWAEEGMNWAVQYGLLSGQGGGILDAHGQCIRAELAQLIKNYFEPREVELPVQGALYGTVREKSGKPLSGAVVTVKGEGSTSFSRTTGSHGEYGIYGLAPGTYTVTAAKNGYVTGQPVEIRVGEDLTAPRQDFSLVDEETAFMEELQAKLAQLRVKFPHGKYWNHRGVSVSSRNSWECVTSYPCSHWGGGSYCNSYTGKTAQIFLSGQTAIQCLGFATMMSDQLFGKTAPMRTFRDFDKLRVGDQIRLTWVVHSMVVIEKGPDYIKVAEVNRDFNTCKIEWDRKITKKQMAAYGNAVLYVTRYED